MPKPVEPISAKPEGSFDATQICIQDFMGTVLAKTPHYKPIDRDHAAAIVHRYNMHSELVEQLQNILTRLDLESVDSIFPCSAMRDDIRRTITRATSNPTWNVQYYDDGEWHIAGIYAFEHDAILRKNAISAHGKEVRIHQNCITD